MVKQRQAPPWRSGGMLAGVSQGTLSVHLDCKGTTQYWKARVPCPVSLCATADADVGIRVLDSEAMKTRLTAITINVFRTDPCQVIITFERSSRHRSFYFGYLPETSVNVR